LHGADRKTGLKDGSPPNRAVDKIYGHRCSLGVFLGCF
jgi:hypothetical protein